MVKNYFPVSVRSQFSLPGLIGSILIYMIVAGIVGFVSGFFTWIPFVGWIFRIIRWGLGAYCGIGMIVSILMYFKILR